MRFEVVVTRRYPRPVDRVWAGLTSAAAIGEWLMPAKGFVAEVGCRFELSCDNEEGGIDLYRCEVLEIDPPTRMRWSWVLAGNETPGAMEVEFLVERHEEGAQLTVFHRGDRDKELLERFKSGWPSKLDRLAQALTR